MANEETKQSPLRQECCLHEWISADWPTHDIWPYCPINHWQKLLLESRFTRKVMSMYSEKESVHSLTVSLLVSSSEILTYCLLLRLWLQLTIACFLFSCQWCQKVLYHNASKPCWLFQTAYSVWPKLQNLKVVSLIIKDYGNQHIFTLK